MYVSENIVSLFGNRSKDQLENNDFDTDETNYSDSHRVEI